MIKRPLSPQFNDAVLTGRKFTTIRASPWPSDQPIMLYGWTGAPYRSKQRDVCPIEVNQIHTIKISRSKDDQMRYSITSIRGVLIHACEGFDTPEQMDEWFRGGVGLGESETFYLMVFNRYQDPEEDKDTPTTDPEDCDECGCRAGEFEDTCWDSGAWNCPECGAVQ